jgi:hypothetical protein
MFPNQIYSETPAKSSSECVKNLLLSAAPKGTAQIVFAFIGRSFLQLLVSTLLFFVLTAVQEGKNYATDVFSLCRDSSVFTTSPHCKRIRHRVS